jgi:hypothetical protein
MIDEAKTEFKLGSVANTNPAPATDANTTDVSIVLVFMAHLLFLGVAPAKPDLAGPTN